uniref:Uncharacterized protein n=1 Tax=Panagrolaimus sp. PS1159 TaxID=55785 RepID=A0AC35G2D8_9BILA
MAYYPPTTVILKNEKTYFKRYMGMAIQKKIKKHKRCFKKEHKKKKYNNNKQKRRVHEFVKLVININ